MKSTDDLQLKKNIKQLKPNLTNLDLNHLHLKTVLNQNALQVPQFGLDMMLIGV
jgi:hypothetical protein